MAYSSALRHSVTSVSRLAHGALTAFLLCILSSCWTRGEAAERRYDVTEGRIVQGPILKAVQGVADADKCADACDEEDACRSYTFSEKVLSCDMRAAATLEPGAYDGYVSGVSRDGRIRALIESVATGKSLASKSQGVGSTETPVSKTNRPGSKRADGTASGFVCETKKVKLEQQSEEFVTLNPTHEWLFPGALLQGATLQGGTPTAISAARSPGQIGLTLQGGGGAKYVEDVARMDLLSTLQAGNNLLARYKGGTPGQISLTYEEVHSQEHLEAVLGVNVTGANFGAGGNFSANFGNNKTHMVVRVVQNFYTLVYAAPRFPEDVFAKDVKYSEVARWIQPGNPPVYVSSVNYGRMLFAILESDLTSTQLEAAFNANYKSVVDASTEGNAKYDRELKNTKISIVIFGASGQGGLTAASDVIQSRSFDGIYDFLRTSGDFGPTNPGVPISYSMRSLYDQRPVMLAATTEFTKNVCSPAEFGCDGLPGSTKMIDKCGVCGGSDVCKRPCAAKTITLGNDYVFVYFDLPATEIGATVKYDDGAFATYKFPRCYRVVWSNARYTCGPSANGGVWKESKDWARDALCHNTGSVDQPNMRVSKE